jgi:3-methylfumaryl-CoA hydratase
MSETNDLARWVGRRTQRTDWINPNHLAAWNATLDRDDPFPAEGDPVPPSFHWALFPPLVRQSELGPDGHAKRGLFLPPVKFQHRMWAGGRIRFLAPLRVGERVEQISTIDRIDAKQGRAGPLVFVTLRHVISRSGANGPAIEEEQDLAYRDGHRTDPAAPQLPPEPAPAGVWRREIVPDDVLLFRYSALTFNGHRIHYDRRYATIQEGYPGLVVHGPLLATLLIDLLRRQVPEATLERFQFRALRPAFDISPITVQGGPGDHARHFRLWSTENRGQVGMQAEAWIR